MSVFVERMMYQGAPFVDIVGIQRTNIPLRHGYTAEQDARVYGVCDKYEVGSITALA
jgi:hypothetical protein